jgi:hypothetical protein
MSAQPAFEDFLYDIRNRAAGVTIRFLNARTGE